MHNSYSHSYGYFYLESDPTNGTVLPLPSNHNINDRRLVDIEWDMCIFLYNNGGEIYFTDIADVNEVAKAADKKGNHFLVDRRTYFKLIEL